MTKQLTSSLTDWGLLALAGLLWCWPVHPQPNRVVTRCGPTVYSVITTTNLTWQQVTVGRPGWVWVWGCGWLEPSRFRTNTILF